LKGERHVRPAERLIYEASATKGKRKLVVCHYPSKRNQQSVELQGTEGRGRDLTNAREKW